MSDVTADDLIGSFKELNMANYTDDDVAELLHWSLLAFDVLAGGET